MAHLEDPANDGFYEGRRGEPGSDRESVHDDTAVLAGLNATFMAPSTLQPGPALLVETTLEQTPKREVVAIEGQDPEQQQHAHEGFAPYRHVGQGLAARCPGDSHLYPRAKFVVHPRHRRHVSPNLVGVGTQRRADLGAELAHVNE